MKELKVDIECGEANPTAAEVDMSQTEGSGEEAEMEECEHPQTCEDDSMDVDSEDRVADIQDARGDTGDCLPGTIEQSWESQRRKTD